MKELPYPYNQQYIPVCEEVYWEEYDTAGNYHWHGTYTGHHVVKARGNGELENKK